jgi:hypothetical protein
MCVSISLILRGISQTVPEPVCRKGDPGLSWPYASSATDMSPPFKPSRGLQSSGLSEASDALHFPFWSLEGSALLRRLDSRGTGVSTPSRSQCCGLWSLHPEGSGATLAPYLSPARPQPCTWCGKAECWCGERERRRLPCRAALTLDQTNTMFPFDLLSSSHQSPDVCLFLILTLSLR